MTKDKEHDDVQRYYNRCRSEEIAADKERADKERDDELIAEMVGVLKEAQAYISDGRPGRHGGINSKINAMIAKLQPAPKPDRAEVLARDVLLAWSGYQQLTDEEAGSEEFAKACRFTQTALDELRAEWEAERPAVVVPEETGWLVETKFGPHIHYMGIKDPHPYWRESRKKDEEFEPYGRRALVGLLSFNKDSNDGLRFARKVDAEAFIAAFVQLMTDPKATEHIWADKQLLDGTKGDE